MVFTAMNAAFLNGINEKLKQTLVEKKSYVKSMKKKEK